jgi:putative transcriptional regulator
MEDNKSASCYLKGQLLVAMPAMQDPRFERTVIFMCAHNADGAMGLIVNKPLQELNFKELLDQLGIERDGLQIDMGVQYGGPVETGRGFVLHTSEYEQSGTIAVDDNVGLTATVEILRDIAGNRGPKQSLLALGYAGWGPGQLENEIQQNAWLNVPADDNLLFDEDIESRWERAIAKLGITPALLSDQHGHA